MLTQIQFDTACSSMFIHVHPCSSCTKSRPRHPRTSPKQFNAISPTLHGWRLATKVHGVPLLRFKECWLHTSQGSTSEKLLTMLWKFILLKSRTIQFNATCLQLTKVDALHTEPVCTWLTILYRFTWHLAAAPGHTDLTYQRLYRALCRLEI